MIDNVTTLSTLAFFVFAGMMMLGALLVVCHRSIIYSALGLLMSFMAIAGMFGLANAPFLAAAQVMVYGVGLTIVILFGIMLTGDKPIRDLVGQERSKRHWLLPLVGVGGLFTLMLWAILKPNFQLTAINGLFAPAAPAEGLALHQLEGAQAIINDGGVAHIAKLLFTQYLVAFELASVLLLLAMVGAILLAKRLLPEEVGEKRLVPTGQLNTPLSTVLGASAGEAHIVEVPRETTGVH
jgi:NADH:ubiquinone oxidoreductase subunit 6 (subunit J)